MKRFILSWFVLSVIVYIVVGLVDDIIIKGGLQVVFFAFWLGLANAVLRPIIVLITMPFIVISFGILLIFINVFLLYLTSLIVSGVEIRSIFGAVVASILISTFTWIVNLFFRIKA